MSSGLRTTFWVHTIVALGLGVPMVFAPQWSAQLIGWDVLEPALFQLYGTLVIALGVSSLLAALAHHWEEVRIVAYSEIAYTAVAMLTAIYLMFFTDEVLPTLMWAVVIMWALFFVAFGFFALQERSRPHPVEPGKPAYR